MADLGALISIAESVFKLLQSPVLKDMKNWQSDLENLNNSVSFIKNMLLDADMKPVLSHEEQHWVDELNQVLYEADDLFDEVITIAKQKELNAPGAKFSKKVLDKVSRFFSSKNRILVSYNTSQEVKSIEKKLDAIAKDHARFKFEVDPHATLNRKVDTCSFLDEKHDNIIGREDDVKFIVETLLDSHVEENVAFVAVVGIGGLGKTTLAQLVYNHHMVKSRFEKKIWACVSDQDGKRLNVREILAKIIESLTTEKPSNDSSMQSLQTKFQGELNNKTYLLILDDVWTKDPNEWRELSRHLTIGGRGSKVVITTHSEETAEVVLATAPHSKKYMLKGLSDENSWRLFVLTAFKRGSDAADDNQLTTIGMDRLPRGMKHLTALENLSIDYCKGLKGLPEWIGCLSSLQSLQFSGCDNLKSLGGIQSITSLQELRIYGCFYLKERCEEPRGKEWPNIQHIPHITLR